MPKPTKKAPIDPQLQADIDYLGTLLAKGISGIVQLGYTDGMKVKTALDRVTKSEAGVNLMAKLWEQFFIVNPQASAAIEMAASMSPKLRDVLERWRMKPKDIPPEDVDVKQAEVV